MSEKTSQSVTIQLQQLFTGTRGIYERPDSIIFLPVRMAVTPNHDE